MIVRHGATDTYRSLRQTFAGEAVHIIWDRRVGERRRPNAPRVLDERRGDRRDAGSPLTLARLPFIAVGTRPPR
jgi:hypothetical protein